MLKKISFIIKDTTFLETPTVINRNTAIFAAWKALKISGVSEKIKENVKIRSIDKEKLILIASNSIYAQEIQLRNIEIVTKINKLLKNKEFVIEDIIIIAGNN